MMSAYSTNNNKAEQPAAAAAVVQALGQDLFETFTNFDSQSTANVANDLGQEPQQQQQNDPIDIGSFITQNLLQQTALTEEFNDALTALVTPELGYLSSPDTIVSHDFEHSPVLQDLASAHPSQFVYNFGDAAMTATAPLLAKDSSLFGDVTLFEDATSPLISDLAETLVDQDFVDVTLESLLQPPATDDAKTETIDPVAIFTAPASPVIQEQTPALTRTASGSSTPRMPPLPRTKSIELAEAAIPKQQRGRKRKQPATPVDAEDDDDEDDDHSRKCSVDVSRMTEAEMRIYQRQKNTEAAARSRARKRAAMAAAEDRILELERETAQLRQAMADKDALIARLQALAA